MKDGPAPVPASRELSAKTRRRSTWRRMFRGSELKRDALYQVFVLRLRQSPLASVSLLRRANRHAVFATNSAVNMIPKYLLVMLLLGATSATGQTLAQKTAKPANPNFSSYRPITARQRLGWVVKSTLGPENLAAGLVTSGFSTARNAPREYGPHWDGFGKRDGMRLTGVSTGSVIEAGLGSLWGEDPRYFPAGGQPIKGRLRNVVVMTFIARRAGGNSAPAYARYLGNAGNNFLSNTWRADSESGVSNACVRIVLGVAGRMSSNAFAEFWPDLRKYAFHRGH